jgi:hypothetical protein
MRNVNRPARIPRFLCLAMMAGTVFAGISWTAGFPQSGQGSGDEPRDPWKSSAGKVVVLVFVRTDCPVSNRYAPEIQRISAEHARDAAFWLVYPDKRETAGEIQKHDREFHYTLPVLRDPQRQLIKRAEVTITPEAAVFDAQGRLVYHGRIDNWFEDFGRARPAPTTHELEVAIATAASGSAATLPSVGAVGCYLSDLP